MGMGSRYFLEQGRRGGKVFRPGATVQLVLEGVLDLFLEFFGNIAPVSNVPDPSEGFCSGETLSKGRNSGDCLLLFQALCSVCTRVEFVAEKL